MVVQKPEMALDMVRQSERARIEAIRKNDADAMEQLLDDKFIYISGEGKLCNKEEYIGLVRSHGLTYSDDLELTETDYRVDGDLVILAGLMRGHARLDREQHVYRHRNMRVWRQRDSQWKLLAWQSSAITPNPIG